MQLLSEVDQDALATAVRHLEQTSLAGRLAMLGSKPAGAAQRALPAAASAAIARATTRTLEQALDLALFSLRNHRLIGGRKLHNALACTSGAVGGAFGLAALTIELPVSTMIMLRAIAAIAREEGEDLADPRTRLACLEVFALSGANSAEADYFAIRAMLARGLQELADFATDKGARKAAAVFTRFLAQIASHFGVAVSQKLAAQAVAVVGALGGAGVNLTFIEYFQDLARGHFIVRRLERVYGPSLVRSEYERLKALSPLSS
ncbi:MAG: EcsC family protein [Alphaproteobacteria bacterium]|nr:EcsC family protein [Alphaproteobacteria bacterium]